MLISIIHVTPKQHSAEAEFDAQQPCHVEGLKAVTICLCTYYGSISACSDEVSAGSTGCTGPSLEAS